MLQTFYAILYNKDWWPRCNLELWSNFSSRRCFGKDCRYFTSSCGISSGNLVSSREETRQSDLDPRCNVLSMLIYFVMAWKCFSYYLGRPQKRCKDPGTQGLLLRSTEAQRSFPPGTKLIYYCPPKFTLKGSRMLFCKRDGTWSASLPRCIGMITRYWT